MFRNIKKMILVVAVAVVAFSGPVALAAQIEGGNFYRVKNVTTNSSYADQVTADKCQTVQFLAQIHNPGPEALTGVRVEATLPAIAADPISSTATISAANAASQTDTATVDLPTANKIDYVPGSTKLLDHNAGVIQSLPDGIVSGGVDVPGGVGVSLQEIRYVSFQANVDCPETPGCTENCEPAKEVPSTKTGVTPSAIASTGPAEIVSGLFGTTALGYSVQRYVASRRSSK